MLTIGPVKAQSIFACQNIKSTGFEWKNNRWSETNYSIGKPFFIKLNGKSIDEESVWRIFSDQMKYYSGDETCTKNIVEIFTCMTQIGESLVFNPKNGEGAKSELSGEAHKSINSSRRDSVTVGLFTCQKM